MKTILIVNFILVIAFLSSCKKTDELQKLPHVEFEIDYELIAVGSGVKISNYSESAGVWRYEWDFGDGSKHLELSPDVPLHKYQSPGEYEIKLTVIGDDYARNSMAKKIRVGESFINQIVINRISEYKNSKPLEQWDDKNDELESLPDLTLHFYENDELLYKSNTYPNIGNQKLPLIIQIPEIRLEGNGPHAPWIKQLFHLYDNDDGENELMLSPRICEIYVQDYKGYDYKSRTAEFHFSCGEYYMAFKYIVK